MIGTALTLLPHRPSKRFWAEVRTEEGKLYMLVSPLGGARRRPTRAHRVSKYAFAELHERATGRVAANFLRRLIELVPYTVHTVLTDNGTHFTSPGNTCSAAKELRNMMERGELFRTHSFEHACAQNDIDHRLTKPNHPWTNGQVERMNRTLKEATVRY